MVDRDLDIMALDTTASLKTSKVIGLTKSGYLVRIRQKEFVHILLDVCFGLKCAVDWLSLCLTSVICSAEIPHSIGRSWL